MMSRNDFSLPEPFWDMATASIPEMSSDTKSYIRVVVVASLWISHPSGKCQVGRSSDWWPSWYEALACLLFAVHRSCVWASQDDLNLALISCSKPGKSWVCLTQRTRPDDSMTLAVGSTKTGNLKSSCSPVPRSNFGVSPDPKQATKQGKLCSIITV